MVEISDGVKRVLKPLINKGFLTEKNLQYLILPKPRLEGGFNYLRFTSVLKMSQVDQLFLIAVQP